MKCSLFGKVFIPLVAAVLVIPAVVIADPVEPLPSGYSRGLRTDYVKTWHVYNDNRLDGVLNPGDKEIATFKNWWTPASSHSQHNYSRDGGGFLHGADSDINSSPLNSASHNSGKQDYWQETEKNSIQFYMTYSQFDNNNWKDGFTAGLTGDQLAIVSQRHETRNGWAMGWVSHSEESTPTNPQTDAGFVNMDIFVHNGKGSLDVAGFGKSYSNPQVSVSNDINSTAIDRIGCVPAFERYHPPVFDETTGTYSWPVNKHRLEAQGLGYTATDLTDIIDSMEIREGDAYALGSTDVIWGNRSPDQTRTHRVDHNGQAYTYDDAFLDNSYYHDGASDGGVIAGLAGETGYTPDPQGGNWGDQQVIRIDISQETLLSGDPATCGNIDKIVIWDFGHSDSTTWDTTTGQQVNPTPIIFLVDMSQTITHGQIYWDDGMGGRIYFPENRIYIAQVTIPEPASLVLLATGAIGLLIKRRRAATR